MTTLMRATSRPHVRRPMPGPGPTPTTPPSSTAGIPCRGADPELFFAETPAGVEAAKALCVDCPLQRRCLAEAIDRREPCGVWGGELFADGAIVPRKRPRGRPRKRDAERDALWLVEHAALLADMGARGRDDLARPDLGRPELAGPDLADVELLGVELIAEPTGRELVGAGAIG